MYSSTVLMPPSFLQKQATGNCGCYECPSPTRLTLSSYPSRKKRKKLSVYATTHSKNLFNDFAHNEPLRRKDHKVYKQIFS